MLKKIRTSLAYRFVFFVLIFVIVSVLAAGLFISIFSYYEFKQTVRQDYRTILKSSASEIRSYVHESEKALETLATLLAYHKPGPEWKKDIVITAFNHVNPKYSQVALIAADGSVTLSSNPANQAVDYPSAPFFAKALKGKSVVSDVQHAAYHMPYVQMAVPIKRLGKIEEVLWGELNLKSVWDVLDGIKIGNNGYVSVLSADGRYISHLEIQPVLKQVTHAHMAAIEKIRDTDGVIDWLEPEKGHFCMATHIKGLDWFVVLNQPVGEIYGHIYKSLAWIAVFTLGICLLVSLVGWRWVRRLLKPVGELHRQVGIIGAGNLDHRVVVASQDEIGDLANEFNRMADDLKKYIDDKVETAKALAHANHLAVLGEASGKMTHEVGNLVNNMALFLNILQKKPLDDQSLQLVSLLQGDMARATAFSRDCLQFASKPRVDLKLDSPEILIEEALIAHRKEAGQRGIALTTNWADGLPKVPLNQNRMHQVINNLVKNSLDAMGKAGNNGRIIVAGDIKNNHFCLTVADTGPGIPVEMQERIFEPFYTSKGKDGTGLGLAILKDIMAAHGGWIDCRCPPGGGTEFRLFFPMER